MTEHLLYAFLLVFVRCSAMLLSSPVFGAQTTPLQVRIFTTLAIAGALAMVIQPVAGPLPEDMYAFAAAIAQEVFAGLLIGMFMSLAMQVAQIAGAVLDLQVGLGISQTMNPLTGVSVTVLSQFKFLLGLVVFLSINGHHLTISALVESYSTMPALSLESLQGIQNGLLYLLGAVFMLALQIAAPVMGVTLIVDAGLGIINKAVPQMQALHVGMPAKMGIGFVALAIALPSLAGGVSAAVEHAMVALRPILRI